jgi:hypothetical protein
MSGAPTSQLSRSPSVNIVHNSANAAARRMNAFIVLSPRKIRFRSTNGAAPMGL